MVPHAMEYHTAMEMTIYSDIQQYRWTFKYSIDEKGLDIIKAYLCMCIMCICIHKVRKWLTILGA